LTGERAARASDRSLPGERAVRASNRTGLVSAGRVGKPHGFDGSFYVELARHDLPEGTEVVLAGSPRTVTRRAGTDQRPLIRLSGLEDPRPLRQEVLLVHEELAEGEWLAADLAACTVVGLGSVRRVMDGPSCSVLELENGDLVPLVSDAIETIDLEAREIRVNRSFLG
jgi:16S rRNA processing protein RimM